MPSTYTTNNGIELIGTGEQSGTWGATTNTNLNLIDTALDGQLTKTLPAAGTSGSPNTLIIQDGTTSDGRNRLVIFNDGSDLGDTAYVQLTPENAEKIMFVRNSLSGGRSIIFFQGTYNASNDFELPNGTDAVIKFNGGGSGAVVEAVFKKLYLQDLLLDTSSAETMYIESTTPTFNLKETDAATDEKFWRLQTSAGVFKVDAVNDAYTTAATAYSVDRSGVAPNLHIWYSNASEAMRVTSAGNVGIGTSTPSTALEVSGTVTADGLTADTADINGGTIDGVTIGGASAGAGTFTTVTGTTFNGGSTLLSGIYPNIVLSETDTTDLNTRLVNNDGAFIIQTAADNGTTLAGRMVINHANGNVTFNDSGTDSDFRIESDTNPNAFFLQGSDGNVGVGTSTPVAAFHVFSEGSDVLRLQRTSINGTSFVTVNARRTTAGGFIGGITGEWDGTDVAEVLFITGDDLVNKDDGVLVLRTASAGALVERVRVDQDGNVGIGTSSPQALLDVSGATGNQLVVATNTNAANTEAGILFKHSTTVNNFDGGGVRSIRSGTNNDFGLALDVGRDGVSTQAIFISGADATPGYVGIGTSNPSSTLDVNGTVTASAFSGPLTGAVTGNASTATKLATARNIALSGDVSGSANFDGSANITISATVADDSHNHIIANVDGLQTALDGKLATGAKAADSELLDGINSTSFVRSDANDDKTGFLRMADGATNYIALGSGSDFRMWHDGTNTYFRNYNEPNGDMLWQTEGTGGVAHTAMRIRGNTPTPNVELYYDNAKKFETTSAGATLSGNLVTSGDIIPSTDGAGNIGTSANTFSRGWFTNLTVDSTIDVRGAIDLADNDSIRMGSSDDWKLFYNPTGSHATIELESDVADLVITDNGTTKFTFDKSSGVFTPSGGVYLGGTVAANLLDDYEQGTWTPAYAGTTGAGSFTYDIQEGYYTKIGNVVTVTGRLRTDAASGATGNAYIDGLPFTPKNVSNAGSNGCGSLGQTGDFNTEYPVGVYAGDNQARLFITTQPSANSTINVMDAANGFLNGTNANGLFFSCTYVTG